MTKIYNKTNNKEKRRELRKNQTPEELIFWAHVKNRKFHGYKFRRQYSIGNYVVDFYCPELKLVVEIDGGQHYEENRIEHDKFRTKFFNDAGMKVRRYTNLDIKNNLESALDDLLDFCNNNKIPGGRVQIKRYPE
jgi:very-short-patch-repair endonuclease